MDTELPNRPRTGIVVSVRLSRSEGDALHELAEKRQTTITEVARVVLVDYLKEAVGGH